MKICKICGGPVSRHIGHNLYACPCGSTAETGRFPELDEAKQAMDRLHAKFVRTGDPEVKHQFDQAYDRWLDLIGGSS